MVGIDGMLLKQAFGAQKWWFLQVLGELRILHEEERVRQLGVRERSKGRKREIWGKYENKEKWWENGGNKWNNFHLLELMILKQNHYGYLLL